MRWHSWSWLFLTRKYRRFNVVAYLTLSASFAAVIVFLWSPVYKQVADVFDTMALRKWVSPNTIPEILITEGSDQDSQLALNLKRWVNQLQNSPSYTKPLPNSLLHWDEVDRKCKDQSESFAISTLKVHADCASYLAAGEDLSTTTPELSAEERDVFAAFSEQFVGDSQAMKFPGNSEHIETALPGVFGVSPHFREEIAVPWIYIAGRTGAVAVYPGTRLIGGTGYTTETRTWYQAAFGGEVDTKLAEPYLTGSLTVPYLDLLASRQYVFVRTYFQTFTHGGKDFVLCVDFARQGAAPGFTGIRKDGLLSSVRWALLASGLFFLLAYLFSRSSTDKYVFDRQEFDYGRLIQTRNSEFSGLGRQFMDATGELSFGKILNFRLKKGSEEEEKRLKKFGLQREDRIIRGYESWRVFHEHCENWIFFGIRFQSVATIPMGDLLVIYDREVVPSCEWVQPASTIEMLFSKEHLSDIDQKLPRYLKRRAPAATDLLEASSDELRAGSDSNGTKSVPQLIGIEPEKLTAWEQQRVYLTLDEATLIKMFKDAEVKAVILESYFRRLLERETIGSLFEGASVQRLVVFPEGKTVDGKAVLTLSESAYNTFKRKILPGYTQPRSLEFVSGSDVWEKGRDAKVYDFAILNDQLVVVTHTVSEVARVDVSTGEQDRSDYRVDGYVSWRKADIEFYRELFIELSEASIEYQIEKTAS